MATDKRLDQVSQLTDFDYALIVKGDQVAKASKQQLAELVGDLLYGATNASSLATVVAGITGKGILLSAANSEGEVDNLNGTFVGVSSGNPIFGLSYGVVYTSNIEGMGGIQIITNNKGSVLFRSKRYGTWTSPTRIDNFGYNTLEELAAALKPLLGL